MNYTQLSSEERHTIDILLNIQKKSVRAISEYLRRSPSTVSREVKRNSINGIYTFKQAQEKYKNKSINKYKFRMQKYYEFSLLFKKYYDKRVHGVKATIEKIKKYHPELKSISGVGAFKLIKSNNWLVTKNMRLRQYYKKGRKRKIGIFTKVNNKRVRPIGTRPKHIDLREEFGHGEVDLIIGRKASGYANILTLTEQKTRATFIRKIGSKNPMKVNSEIYKLIKKNKLDVKTITVDNGIEFEKIGLLAHGTNSYIYICEPYASYQRGSNEHYNGIFRRFYKKGTDFNSISEDEIKLVECKINSMPREIFGGKSSLQMYK